MKKMTAAVIAALIACAAPSATWAQTSEPVSFTLNNMTDHVLVALFISTPNTNEWEEDIFGQDVLGSGDSVEVTIDDDLDGCEYDLKAVFSDDTEVVMGRQDFCELDGGSIDIED